MSPHLSWSNPPDGTGSFLVMVFDTSASDFIHWVVFDIALTVSQISEGGPAPGGETLNGYGVFGYGGPCPPTGEEHVYRFIVHALDFAVGEIGLTAGQAVTRAEVDSAMAGHILGRTAFTARFTGP